MSRYAPDDGHPRRCQCFPKKKNGKQCGNWALKGSRYCKFHGGRMRKARGEVRVDNLPRFYRYQLSKTLQERVDEMLDTAPEEQINLFEELALMRTMAAEAVGLFSKAESSKNDSVKVAAADLMRTALKDVAQICESAARVVASGKDKISVHDVQHIVHQIVRVAYATLDDESARAFEKALHRDVRLPGRDTSGTDLTPDNDVLEMDSMVPRE